MSDNRSIVEKILSLSEEDKRLFLEFLKWLEDVEKSELYEEPIKSRLLELRSEENTNLLIDYIKGKIDGNTHKSKSNQSKVY